MAAAIGFGADPVKDGDYRWRLTWMHSQTGANIAGRNNRADGAFLRPVCVWRDWAMSSVSIRRIPICALATISSHRTTGVPTGAWMATPHACPGGLGVDAVLYNPDKESNRQNSRQWGVYGNAQYRINRNDMVGASANWNSQRRFDASQNVLTDGQRSLQANAFYQTRLIGRPHAGG